MESTLGVAADSRVAARPDVTHPSRETPQAVAVPADPPSFTRTLVFNVLGLVMAVGLALLIAMVWQGVASTEKAARQEIAETLDRATERLRILIHAAEMTLASAERAARTHEVTGATLRSTLESSLAAFEQRPELSYLGIVLAETGEYGNLERTAAGEILLWLFPGARTDDPVTRNFLLTDTGFVLREERPTDGYDPRNRPFYQAALQGPAGGTWMPAYQWIVHFEEGSEPLWGLSYVKSFYDASGRLIGVLDADFDLPALNTFLDALARDYRAGFQVVELGAVPLLIGDRAAERAPLPVPASLDSFIDFPGDVFVDRMEMEGERRWAAARRMMLEGGISWLVVASRDATFIEAPLRRQLYQVAGMGLAIVLGLALISVRMARRFGRPLAELEKRVASFGRREADATAAVSATAGFREIRLLSDAFSRMAIAVRQHERELSAQNGRLRSHLENTPLGVVEWDAGLRIASVNTSAAALFRREAAALIGLPVVSLVAPEERPRAQAAFDPAASAARQRQVLAKGWTGDSQAVDCEWYVTQLDADDAGRAGGCALVLDVSQLFEAREQQLASLAALRDSLARFHAAARATGDVIWDWDLTTDGIWWNENFRTIFGYPSGEIEPTIESWTRRIHPDDGERVIAHIHAVIDGAEETWWDEYRFRRRDGSYADVFDRGYVLRDESGRAMRMVGAIQDISERKQAQARLLAFNAELEQRVAHRTQELQTLNHELESFCYSVSHDLRAPLRGIAGFAEILVRNYAGVLDDKGQDYLRRVLAATQRMGELIDDLLKLSRVSRERMHRQTVDLSAIASEILAGLQEAAPERRVEITVEKGLVAEGDPRLLRIVLENLLGNAWKFTSRTPAARIAFTAASDEHGAPAFVVSDNGAGFDMRYANMLFSPFQRLHHEAEFPGTGIGLATVQRIVSRHGGRISAQGEPGNGATFRFSL